LSNLSDAFRRRVERDRDRPASRHRSRQHLPGAGRSHIRPPWKAKGWPIGHPRRTSCVCHPHRAL